jgi:Protein of unknown function (DUF742)
MRDIEPMLPDPRMIPPWQAPSAGAPPPVAPTRAEPAWDESADEPGEALADAVLVRPFLVTGGRTRPLHDGLRIETLVSARPAALSAPLRFELRRIVEVCQRPQSVAEIAVRLGVPLGVARVLIADLVTEGLVTVEESRDVSIEIIERIRDRVRAL